MTEISAPSPHARTPVLIGVGQFSERIDAADDRQRSPAELAAEAARAALNDSKTDSTALAAAIDTIATTRQLENSNPTAQAPLGRLSNLPYSIAKRIGANPKRAVLEVVGGQSPQHLVNEFAHEISEGRADVVLLAGAEAISTQRHVQDQHPKACFNETPDGPLEDRGYGLGALLSRQAQTHGLIGMPSYHALLDNARRARLKRSLADYRLDMGRLFAPFTKVASSNPHAAAPLERSAGELATPSPHNRPIADPYLHYLVSRDQVNQAAAVILTSVERARQLGVSPECWVFLHGHADLVERSLLERADLAAYPAAGACVREALRVAGIGLDEIAAFDLYSCFPITVWSVCDAVGLAEDDPRGLTLTGGLPFFGAPGNNYAMHAIADAVQRARRQPGDYVLVGANGGMLSKYSVGIYSTRPTPRAWVQDASARLQQELDTAPSPGIAVSPEGWATVETYTLIHTKHAPPTSVVVARLESGGQRFLANIDPRDTAALKLLQDGEPFGQRLYAHATARGNRILSSPDLLGHLYPTSPPVLREDYQFIKIHRNGHVLELTINRPDVRNALHLPCNDELDHAFTAFFADPELWVAILTGAGDKAFCAGNDLVYTASGKPMWIPLNGFAGLTSRRGMTKPVIAAINGFAMGGGFEIALACHLIVADASARFALSEVKVGLFAGAGGLIRLPRSIPPKKAYELILTGRQMDAAEALTLGVVNQVVEAGQALKGARALAAQIVQGSPTSIRLSLQVMNETQAMADPLDAVLHPTQAVDELLASHDAWEGMRAFAEKRAPNWKNR